MHDSVVIHVDLSLTVSIGLVCVGLFEGLVLAKAK